MGRTLVSLSLIFWIFNVWISLMFCFFDWLVQCLQCKDVGSKAMAPVSPHTSMFPQNNLVTFHWKNRMFCYSFSPLFHCYWQMNTPPFNSCHLHPLIKRILVVTWSLLKLQVTLNLYWPWESPMCKGALQRPKWEAQGHSVMERQGFVWGKKDIKLLNYRMVIHITKG